MLSDATERLAPVGLGMQRVDVWRGHAAKHLPLAACYALGALICWQSAEALFGPLVKPAVIEYAPSRPPHHGIEVSGVVNKHLFGVASQDPADQDPATAARSAANLILTGTLAAKDPKRGKAIIAAEGASKVLSVGDDVGGASLHLVYADRVILMRQGVLESLFLPREESPQVRAVTARASRPAASPLRSVPPGAAQTATEPASLVERYADANVELDGDGNMLGIRVVPGKDREGFLKAGLVGGDIIVSLDGAKLDSPDHSEEVWKHAGIGSSVTVLRRGKLMDLTLAFPPP